MYPFNSFHRRQVWVVLSVTLLLGIPGLSGQAGGPGFAPLMSLIYMVREEMEAGNYEQAESLVRLGLRSIESQPGHPFNFELNVHFSSLMLKKEELKEALEAASRAIAIYETSGLAGIKIGDWFCFSAHQIRYMTLIVQGRLMEAESDLASMRQVGARFLAMGELPPFPWEYPLVETDEDDLDSMKIQDALFEHHVSFYGITGQLKSALTSLQSQVNRLLGQNSLSEAQKQHLNYLLTKLMVNYEVAGMWVRAEEVALVREERLAGVEFPAETRSMDLVTPYPFSTTLPGVIDEKSVGAGQRKEELDELRKMYAAIQQDGTIEDRRHALSFFVTQLIRHGEKREALRLIAEALPEMQARNLKVDAAILHSKALLTVEELEFEEADYYFREGLRLVREAGALAYQFGFYERYARWLWSVGRHADALRVFYQYLDLIEQWDMEHRSVLAVFNLAAWHLLTGDVVASRENLESVQFSPLLGELGDRMHLSMLSLQADLARATGNEGAYAEARQELDALFARAALNDEQERQLRPAPFSETFEFIEMQRDNRAIWNALQVTTTVRSGEVGRGRFDLINTEPFSVAGLVSLQGARRFYEAPEAGEGPHLLWSTLEAASGGAEAESREVQLGPLEMRSFYLEDFIEEAEENPRAATLRWEADNAAAATWIFRAEEESGRRHAVNANRIRYNPYFSLSHYHELYNREPTEKWLDFRIVSPIRLRIEYVDPDSQRLLAVDAQGDGSFRGTGDFLYADGNGSGYFDVVIPAGGVRALEFRLYTAEDEAIPEGEYPLSIQTRAMFGEWREEGRDTLIFGKEE